MSHSRAAEGRFKIFSYIAKNRVPVLNTITKEGILIFEDLPDSIRTDYKERQNDPENLRKKSFSLLYIVLYRSVTVRCICKTVTTNTAGLLSVLMGCFLVIHRCIMIIPQKPLRWELPRQRASSSQLRRGSGADGESPSGQHNDLCILTPRRKYGPQIRCVEMIVM